MNCSAYCIFHSKYKILHDSLFWTLLTSQTSVRVHQLLQTPSTPFFHTVQRKARRGKGPDEDVWKPVNNNNDGNEGPFF